MLCLGVSGAVQADVRLPAVVSDHMVLQAGKPAAVWGWADPGEKVSVQLGNRKAETVAGSNGKWSLKVDLPAGEGPHELVVRGKNTLTVNDVLVGEVWICSGQSNMEWSVAQALNPKEEAEAANFPKIRHFKVSKVVAHTPADDVKGAWVVCAPNTVSGFSAVGYFFGRELHQKLNQVPVGLVGSNWGGTVAEAWTSRPALEAASSLKPMLDRYDASAASFDEEKAKAAFEKASEAYDKAKEKWKADLEKAKAEGKPLPQPLRPPAQARNPKEGQNFPANLYNGMIAPLLPMQIRGAIWYQGESNVGRAIQYRTVFPTMIANWRADFAQGDFPFHFVQLAPYGYARGKADADLTPCAELWEAQLLTLRKVANTGMAVTTDIGDVKDIHPKNKQEVGRRLALWALARDYGQKNLVYSGPLYTGSSVEGDKVRIRFEHGAGLKARDGKALTHFTIAGADQKFVEAEAVVDGETLVVKSASVPQPVAVRFAWREDAEPNLVNGAGLPASPFRTDDFPAVTAGKE
ncbi:MAG: hypothetical protein RLZZ399_2332 [Verrucomicrobiota bacterium]